MMNKIKQTPVLTKSCPSLGSMKAVQTTRTLF